MQIVTMSTLTTQIEVTRSVEPMSATRRFHLFMASACSILLIIDVLGCRYASIHVAGVGGRGVAVLLLTAMVMPVAAYGHEKGKIAARDATLTIPWAFLLFQGLSFPVLIGARLRIPLRDALLAHGDRLLGVSVPGVTVPSFALLPAVGPWYFYGFSADSMQSLCQRDIFRLRLPGAYSFLSQQSGIVCFPSFHVVWAVLCAAALWGFRPLRVPVAVFSAMIVLSTLTTGWHYFIDVLGGLVLGAASVALAKFFLRDHRVRDTGEENTQP